MLKMSFITLGSILWASGLECEENLHRAGLVVFREREIKHGDDSKGGGLRGATEVSGANPRVKVPLYTVSD